MATLKIYNDIVSEEEKIWYAWGGMDGVCYKDIDTFCDSIPKDDDTIDMRIFCNGGSVQDGWAMYDRLRATGKKIVCTVEGKAASMATVLLMAAKKEDRHAYENASLCVHNPWVDPYYLGGAMTADDLRKAADDLQREQDKILDLYVERCGCDRDEMKALMDEDKYIDTGRAIELGLIADVLPPLSGSKKATILYNTKKVMEKEKDNKNKNAETVEVKKSFIDRLLGYFGKSSVAEITFGMDLNTADGNVLTVEREEGEPQVGDKASPDGTWIMPDGKTIVVADGVITEITTDGSGDETKGEDGDGDGDGGDGGGDADELQKLKEENERLKEENEKLKEELDQANAKARTAPDLRILNAVKMAGGEKALAKLSSNYKPEPRKMEGKQATERTSDREAGKNAIIAKLKEARKK